VVERPLRGVGGPSADDLSKRLGPLAWVEAGIVKDLQDLKFLGCFRGGVFGAEAPGWSFAAENCARVGFDVLALEKVL
jgi:hypothetical protein